MADTRVQREVAKWVRGEPPAQALRPTLRAPTVKLTPGGEYSFDAVSNDGMIVASVSTSRGPTATGKMGTGKLSKLRSDILFLIMAPATKRVLCLTERDMFDVCSREQSAGRLPDEVEIILATIPPDLDARLRAAREVASKEVLPPKP